MKRRRYGRIIFTTSGREMVLEAARAGLAGYALGKMAQLGLMTALAAEGEAYQIYANAISPVAAARMFQQEVAPGELRPEQAAPAVAYLASAHCRRSGLILRAANGRYSLARWSFTPEIQLPGPANTPEAIAEYIDSLSKQLN